MLFVSVAITISMISLLFLVETSIKNHFLDLDNETIDNKTIIIEQFSKRIDAVQRIINWDTINPDSNFYIEILKDGKNITLNFWIDLLLHLTAIGEIIFALLVVLDVVNLA